MRSWLLWLSLLLVVLANRSLANPFYNSADNGLPKLYQETYLEDEDQGDLQGGDSSSYTDNALENLMRAAQKRTSSILYRRYLYRRACIRRGGNCDHRPKDCCYSSSCRCNLWGSNCQCQRMGLFQKWG